MPSAITQYPAHAENPLHDGLAHRVGIDAPHQRHVQLDDVGLELGQQVEPGIAGAEVVDGGHEFLPLVLVDDLLQVGLVHQLLAFGDLEDDPLGGKAEAPRRRQGGADAGGRPVDRVGQEIDAQPAGHTQPGGQLDGLDPAGLVEGVAVLVVDPGEHAGRPAAVGAAHQRLVGIQAAVTQVDDGLEGHAEIEIQGLTVPAGGAGREGWLFAHAMRVRRGGREKRENGETGRRSVRRPDALSGATLALGRVKRLVGVAQQRGNGIAGPAAIQARAEIDAQPRRGKTQ